MRLLLLVLLLTGCEQNLSLHEDAVDMIHHICDANGGLAGRVYLDTGPINPVREARIAYANCRDGRKVELQLPVSSSMGRE